MADSLVSAPSYKIYSWNVLNKVVGISLVIKLRVAIFLVKTCNKRHAMLKIRVVCLWSSQMHMAHRSLRLW